MTCQTFSNELFDSHCGSPAACFSDPRPAQLVTIFESVFPVVFPSLKRLGRVEACGDSVEIGLGSRLFQFQDNLKGVDWLRHIVVHSTTATALNKTPAMSPSWSVHRGQYDTMYASIGCVLRKAFTDDTMSGDKREPARNLLKLSCSGV